MAEHESVLEKRLIDQLCSENSQWTYRPDIRNEEQLWANFKYILEQNNKARLGDTPLSDSEFAKIKNDVSHSSFYEAGKWLVGENGKVLVHIQRGNENIHLVVMNHEHIAGGTTTYEVINQFQSFKTEEDKNGRDRRFDVTLLINGLPMIHIELKNKEHSYIEAFNQIKKYIAEGKFRGAFSNVQMFVVSNAIDTKYFAAARDTELNKKFLVGWLDEDNNPVTDYIEFAKDVLRIPQAHEIVTKYTVLDNDKKKLLTLRAYQIHAIEAMREASKRGESGFIWHTTGSGKTMTSFKATRNLLMDIPSIQKTVFLIDRKDLDTQTTMAFQSYADNDIVDVDNTDNVDDLIKKLSNGDQQMIVTTRQKLQTMINKKLQEGSKQYDKIRSVRVAFVVDECHRAVTPQTKRDIDSFFNNPLWYGFTGTPIFEENKYDQMGDLPQTTEQMYGRCLHSYTIKEAIHDEAVLGFMVENLGAKGISEEQQNEVYDSKKHMRSVLDSILNHSFSKLGMQNGKGRTYEALLTVKSIAKAQEYYDLLKDIKDGKDELKISEDIKQVLPDFPKFAITYSLSENEESSTVNQEKMKASLEDYNAMFGTHYGIDGINAYNANLNERLARKETRYFDREQQLDLVIVVNRLLTGFDAPCLSTLFIDRQPMSPQDLIQAFSRTNRLFDTNKQYGQIVTFQSPVSFKTEINNALMLYSRGGTGEPIAEDWEDVLDRFKIDLKALRGLAETPDVVSSLSRQQKKTFIQLFRALDRDFAHLKAFSVYDPIIIEKLDFSEELYEDYAAAYKNVVAELKADSENESGDDATTLATDDYELVAFSKLRIDFEYIVLLLQGIVETLNSEDDDFDAVEFDLRIKRLREIINDFANENPKLSALLLGIIDDIEKDKEKYIGQDVSVIINQMRYESVDTEIKKFAEKWFLDFEDVKYEVYNYRDGEMANATLLKEKADYAAYKESVEEPLKKFKFNSVMIDEFKEVLMEDVGPLL